MSLASTLTITVNTIARTLNRILGPERVNNEITSTFANPDESSSLIIAHRQTNAARVRHRVRFVDVKVSVNADTGLPVQNPPSVTFEITIDRPIIGYSVAEIKHLSGGFKALLTDAFVESLYGKES